MGLGRGSVSGLEFWLIRILIAFELDRGVGLRMAVAQVVGLGLRLVVQVSALVVVGDIAGSELKLG